MATELENRLRTILEEKLNKIKPENIKSGVKIFDIEGTLEEGSSIPSTKLFTTEEEMQADPTAKEGDLAVVYSQSVSNMTATTETQTITFPQTVVLSEAFTGSVNTMLRTVDNSVMFDAQVMLDSTMFNFDAYTEDGSIRVQYESSDGITYTRTDSGDETIDCGTSIKCYYEEEWNDVLGYFMQVPSMYFGGLHKYLPYLDKSMFRFVKLSDITITDNVAYWNGNYDETAYDVEKLKSLYRKMYDDGITSNQRGYFALNENNQLICFSYYFASTGQINGNAPYYIVHNGSSCIGLSNTVSSAYNDPSTVYVYALDLENQTYTKIMETSNQGTISVSGSNYYTYPVILNSVPIYWAGYDNDIEYKLNPIWLTSNLMDNATGTACNITNVANNINLYETKYKYFVAPSQLTLNSPTDLLPEKIAYGQTGIIEGDGSIQVPNNTFADTPAKLYWNIKQAYDSMEPRVLTDTDKQIDEYIYFIPVNSAGETLLDLSNVTNTSYMFTARVNLTTIPALDTSNATVMNHMFSGCTNLKTVESLDTSNATSVSSIFFQCPNLVAVPTLDLSNATNASYMFSECTNLITIPSLNTNKVTNMMQIFYNCKNLETVESLDTSSATTLYGMFSGCANLKNVPTLNTSNVTNMSSMFLGCKALTTIPSLNTDKVTNMSYMFSSCINLVTIPILNTSQVTNMQSMFSDMEKLSDESLNNILSMCANATAYTSTKTLKYIGLTEEQATKCQSLSNYQAFLDAGWTTGY